MLSPAEKTGLENLLNELENCDLFSLFGTITKRMIREAQSRQEAITTIISCVEKPTDVLKRQKITKKILYNYLRKLCGSISPENSKLELVNKCLQEWESTDTSQTMDCWDYETEEVQTLPVLSNLHSVHSQSASKEQLFGAEFVKWFFPLYNRLNDFGVQHFWPDVTLEGRVESPSENQILKYQRDSEIVAVLASLISCYKITFLPNDSSVQCTQEQHGLVKIDVKGTVHQLNNPIGLFELIFGLVRNPEHEYNYRIKHIILCMKVNVAFNNLLPMA